METMDKGNTRVLVTGASGYVGIHCIKQLLQEGYQTRGTVRSSSNEMKIAPLIQLEGSEKLELVEADLCKDIGWTEAVKDCTYILHVASPFPLGADEMVIQTAVDGTLRVLKAAAKQPSVKKVVLTSSSAAINEGHDADQNRMFDENDWTNLESNTVMNYTKSKTLAEKAAWDFMKQQPGVNFKLTTINPTLVVGPLLHNVQGTSITVIRRFLNNEMPMVPALEMGLVDVRDVASAHIRAMTTQESDGERILVTAQPSMTFLEIANCLRKVFGPQGYTLPRYEAPYCLLWLYSCFDKEANEGRMRVGRRVLFDNSKAKKLLNMDFIDPHKSLVEMSYDIIDRGMVKKSPKYTGRQAEMA